MSRKSKKAKKQETVGERTAQTRRPLYRIYEIHSEILSGSYPNCNDLAKKLQVERKTIQRDISFMRDELGLPLVYENTLHGYFYESDISGFPIFQTTTDELAGLFLARNALESVRGTALATVLQDAFSKLTRGMMDKIQFSWSDLDEAFSRKTLEQKPRDIKRLGEITQSILNQQVTTFYYRKMTSDEAELRKAHPLHLGEVDGGWYLIAFDADRQALRTFALPRISRIKTLSTKFNRPLDFDGRAYLNRSFGIWNVAGDDARHEVRVELRGYAAAMAQERRWHPTQETKLLNAKGTRVEVCFEVGRLEEVLRWVLSFGSCARALAPKELADMVKQEIRAMQAE